MFGWLLTIASVVVADLRAEKRSKLLEELMTVLSDQIAALNSAVTAAGERVAAEVADLETKIADPNTTVTTADLDGLKSAIDGINAIAAENPVEVPEPTTGETPVETTPDTPEVPVETPTEPAPVDGDAGAGTPDTGTEVSTPAEPQA